MIATYLDLLGLQRIGYGKPLVLLHILQLFIKNSIWHVLKGKESPRHIIIDIKRKDDMLLSIVEDDELKQGQKCMPTAKNRWASHLQKQNKNPKQSKENRSTYHLLGLEMQVFKKWNMITTTATSLRDDPAVKGIANPRDITKTIL